MMNSPIVLIMKVLQIHTFLHFQQIDRQKHLQKLSARFFTVAAVVIQKKLQVELSLSSRITDFLL